MDATPPSPPPPASPALTALHRRRLREVYRSAGWPWLDAVEIDLLAAGLLERVRDAAGCETVRVTDAGLRCAADAQAANRRARDRHEALVARVATEMQRTGRLVWRGLVLRAPLDRGDAPTQWVQAMPDVFSIRHTTREDWVEPIVHEIKVSRADLRADLRLADKRAAYHALASQCWYVLADGIARPDEVPPECGVMVERGGALEVLRPAPRRAHTLPLATWMALARAHAEPPLDAGDAQPMLAAVQDTMPPPHDAAADR